MSIFVFTQNVKLESLAKYSNLGENENLIITTQILFENEKKVINSIFSNCLFHTFADYLSDEEMSRIDQESYESPSITYEKYLKNIKLKKNELVSKKVISAVQSPNRYIFSDDLGVDLHTWKKVGFNYLEPEYYYFELKPKIEVLKNFLKGVPGLRQVKNLLIPRRRVILDPSEVNVAYFEGRKYIFLGSMNRIRYRLNIDFVQSIEECEKINSGHFETCDTCTYIVAWHEHWKSNVPDDPKYEVRWAQDGYLPSNYSHKDYFFKPDNVKYFCWDILGTELFVNQGLPYELIPFRKKLYLPNPVFPSKICNILVVASGSGDWTALKNRSDDDSLVEGIVQMAKRFPDIHFTYRCHPSWVHPQHVGVNSINRVYQYFLYLNLSNLTLSSNIPSMKTDTGYRLSFSRSSLDDDLADADFVIGEHSISMIDAAFKRIPFASVNLTKRRNFFAGINDLGFPYCSSIDEMECMIKKIYTSDFQTKYLSAIENYNKMTTTEG